MNRRIERVVFKTITSSRRCLHSTPISLEASETQTIRSSTIARLSREVKAEDLLRRPMRTTHQKILYPSDFSTLDPILDHPYPAQHNNNPTAATEPGATEYSHLPQLPPDTTGEGQAEDETELLAKATGLSTREIKALIQRPLVIRRVVNQTRKGKQASMYTLAVVGNGQGMIGFGEGKHTEQATATRKAVTQAVKNMEFVHRYQNRTIYGDIDFKFHAVQLRLRSRPAGFGLRANHFIHEICRCAGITDISAKVWGSRTGMNVVKALFGALKSQKLPTTIARERGRKVVDLEQTYYGR